MLSGGSAAPRALAERYLAAGVEFVSSWGMTEAGSGTTLRLTGAAPCRGSSRRRCARGPRSPASSCASSTHDGHELPWDDRAVGELEARGLWVCRAYLDVDEDTNRRAFDDGWLRTGDMARIDPAGSVEIVDRLKDLIKSGGEWISSTELESHLARQPAVAEAAVIAIADETLG